LHEADEEITEHAELEVAEMRLLVAAAVVLTLLVTFAGCIQARVGSPEYNDPYGPDNTLPEKRWWGDQRPGGDEDTDKFMDRWNHLKE
jgi:hypothetical protein